MKRTFILLLLLACASASFAQLSGPLSGTLGPGEFHVVDTISVESTDTLRLLPGTTFMFDGAYPFAISGMLLAEGTDGDSIFFTTDTVSNPSRWQGLRFFSGGSGSRLAHCLVESGYASGPSWVDDCGGGVYCNYSSPSFSNCTISGNSAAGYPYYGYGGGVYCNYSSPSFSNCTISGNSAYWAGGGVYCTYSSPSFSNCTLSDNSADGYPYHGWGGGVFCQHSSPSFSNCTISGNSATYSFCGGVYLEFSSASFVNTIVAFSQGAGIYFWGSPVSRVHFCDIFGNTGGDFAFLYDDHGQGPAGLGELVHINANGDSADVLYNIFEDPFFANARSGDYHLSNWSRCIGAGDPSNFPPTDAEGNPRPNPAGSNSDIGAYEHPASGPLDATRTRVTVPHQFALNQNYPNPFNPTTMIRYDVPTAGKVSLTIFNLLGQRVATLFDQRQLAGTHTIAWDAANLPSGIYLCRMDAPQFVQTRKMLLVK